MSVKIKQGNERTMQDDDIDLRELLSVIWDGKWIIIAVMVLFSIVGVYFAVTLPNIYRAEAFRVNQE